MTKILIAWALIAQSMAFGQTFEEHCKNSANLPPAQQKFIRAVLKSTYAKCDTVQEKVSKYGELSLSYDILTDISLIASIKDIKTLWLRENQIDDISALAKLESLERLSVADNMLTDISALAGLDRLVELNIYDNFVSDLTPLKTLTNLKKLDLQRNAITDYSPLQGLVNLAELTVGDSFWDTPSRCQQENRQFTQQDNATAASLDAIIANLKSLESFRSNGINFTSTANIEKLTQLRVLGIRCASIESTKTLTALPKLESLVLSYNRLHSIEPLAVPKPFEDLVLKGNLLANSEVLASFSDLRRIDLSDNALTGEFVLKSRNSLRRLELAGNALKYVDLQGEFPKLYDLDISRNQIKHIHFANSRDQLTYFIAHHNRLVSPAAAMNFNEVSIVDIAHNDIWDFTFINDIDIEEESEGITVHAGGNPSSDFSTITNPELARFIARESGLTDSVNLPATDSLRHLDIGDNKFSDLKGLSKKYPYLDYLFIDGNPLTDGDSLPNFKGLRSLDASRTKIRSWDFLAEFEYLRSISLRGNRITDLSFLENLWRVTGIDLAHNNIDDLAPFNKVTLWNLSTLNLNSNLVTDATPLGNLKEMIGFWGMGLKDNPLGTTIEKTPENCPTTSPNRTLNRWCKFGR